MRVLPRPQEALDLAEEAIDILKENVSLTHEEVVQAQIRKGEALLALEKAQEAIAFYLHTQRELKEWGKAANERVKAVYADVEERGDMELLAMEEKEVDEAQQEADAALHAIQRLKSAMIPAREALSREEMAAEDPLLRFNQLLKEGKLGLTGDFSMAEQLGFSPGDISLERRTYQVDVGCGLPELRAIVINQRWRRLFRKQVVKDNTEALLNFLVDLDKWKQMPEGGVGDDGVVVDINAVRLYSAVSCTHASSVMMTFPSFTPSPPCLFRFLPSASKGCEGFVLQIPALF